MGVAQSADLGVRVSLQKLLDALGVGEVVLRRRGWAGIPRKRERRFGEHARKRLRGAVEQGIVVHEHVLCRVALSRAGVGAQRVHGEVSQLACQDAAGEPEVVPQGGGHGLLFERDEPSLVVIGEV